jgi:hypothetical protein
MNILNRVVRKAGRVSVLVLTGLCCAIPASARILDDFNDNTKTGWTDFTFVPGLGIAAETGGQLLFEQPPAGQALFSACRRTSEVLELKEGRTLEMRVDVLEAGDKDSFPVLAFIPEANTTDTLAGYGIAKSTTDFLITKGINKYFYNEHPAEPIKQTNISLVLTLTVRNGNVHIRARVLDKDAGDAVIFEQEAVDTPAADVLSDGTDSPAAPYIAKGHFTLYLYQDYDAGAPEMPYRALFDNVEVFETDREVLDDFDDATKTGWTDFTFVPGLGIASETGGQFRFEQPPAGQPLFSASRKTSKLLALREGERLQFEVDVPQGGGEDSFAVLAFLPEANDTSSLAGYGLAKSTSDLLITKGINRYFFNENLEPPVKQDNIRLGLILTARQGRVEIETEVRDLDLDGAVIYRQFATDTPQADVMSDGTDDPAAPFITSGHYSLYLYQDFSAASPEDPYRVYYDNAVVHAAPAPPNAAPIISNVQPAPYGNFLPANTTVGFTITDDLPVVESLVSVTLNGTVYTTANGLVLAGAGTTRTVTLPGVVAGNGNYAAVISVADAAGASATASVFFDTFAASTLVVESEDYNFDGGGFVENPVPIPENSGPEPNAYGGQTGVPEVDYFETRSTPNGENTRYRYNDPIRMQRSFDIVRSRYVDAGGAAAEVYDYEVGDFVAGEWMNYTRTFASGSYEVYLRQSQVNHATSECVLERVSGSASEPNQETTLLGSFLGVPSGFLSRNIPLTDGTGQNKIVLRLAGPTTLRMRQVTTTPGDAARSQNYLAFVRVSDAGPQPALISSLTPAPDTVVETVTPSVRVEIQNRDTAVVTSSVELRIGGAVVPAVVTPTAGGATVVYAYPTASLPPSGSLQNAQVSFRDSEDDTVSATWSYTITYKSLLAENRSTAGGSTPGFVVRVVQAPAGSGLDNSLQRAEDQLRANSPYPAEIDVTTEAAVINFSQSEGGGGGVFGDNLVVPGIDGAIGTDDFVLEARCWLSLAKGVYRFGVITDDGFKINSGATPGDISGGPLDFHNGGPANKTFDFVVPETGLYPFRFLWYERGGDAHGEWFSENITTGERVLINDLTNPQAVAAFQNVGGGVAPTAQASLTLATDSWAAAPDAVVNAAARTVTVPISGATRFIRLVNPVAGGAAPVITATTVQGGNLVITYTLP